MLLPRESAGCRAGAFRDGFDHVSLSFFFSQDECPKLPNQTRSGVRQVSGFGFSSRLLTFAPARATFCGISLGSGWHSPMWLIVLRESSRHTLD